MNKNPVRFNNTVLRDGHQSLAATRMRTDQMLPVAGQLDKMGFGMLETWGGATIDSCLRYLSENPFERITRLKEAAPQTPQGLLMRGQNIVQYTAFPDDVVEAFVRSTAVRGMDLFRIFDALNDVRNLEFAVRAVKRSGKHAQGAISYTISPVHTIAAFVELGIAMERMGCDSVCVKDMAGLLTPSVAGRLVGELKQRLKVPVTVHSHSTAGLAPSAYLAAIDAGVDAVDVSVAPFGNGSGQPDISLMLALLDGHPRKPEYDLGELPAVREHLDRVYAELSQWTSPANERVDIGILRYQIPGGMLSNFLNQLKEQGLRERWPEVAAEMIVVREALGWIPLVTPTSQIVGTQAAMNVKFGRWKSLSQPTMDVVLGKYGKTPGEIDPDVARLVKERSKQDPITGRAADLLPPRMESLLERCKELGLPVNEETAVLLAMFPSETEALYRPKQVAVKAAPAQPAPAAAPVATVSRPVAPAGAVPDRKMVITIGSMRKEVTVSMVS